MRIEHSARQISGVINSRLHTATLVSRAGLALDCMGYFSGPITVSYLQTENSYPYSQPRLDLPEYKVLSDLKNM